jgi:hypothetical protein
MPRNARCAPWSGKRPVGQLSAVLTPSRRVRDGERVEVELGDGRLVVGRALLLDDGKIRVFLPEGYA